MTRTEQIINLFLVVFTILSVSSMSAPVPNNITPMIAKSAMLQLTSFVNCIAMNGIVSSIAAVVKMMSSLLCFIVAELSDMSVDFLLNK